MKEGQRVRAKSNLYYPLSIQSIFRKGDELTVIKYEENNENRAVCVGNGNESVWASIDDVEIIDADLSRKETPVYSGFMKYFPKAIREVSRVSYNATQQHHPTKEMHWDKGKSKDHLDSMIRHLLDVTDNNTEDGDKKEALAKVAWRAMAELEIYLESNE